MFKKLLALSLVFIGALTLSACNPDTGLTTEEILTQIQEAVDNLSLPAQTSANLTLPNSEVHDVTITWASSNTDFISNAGVITAPTKTQGNKTVTMTATLSLEDQQLVKTFSVIVLAATALNDTEKVAADKADVFVQEGPTFADVTLATTGANGTTITWASSNAAVISTAGVITRPASDAAEVTVTLTATITSGSVSDTKAFVLRVQPAVDTTTIAEIIAAYSATVPTLAEGDSVSVKGVVTGLVTVSNKGFYIYDGTGFIMIYSDPVYEVGDVVLITGEFDDYYGLFEIKNLSTSEILNETIAMPTPLEVTIADIIAYGTNPTYAQHSVLIKITGTVTMTPTDYYLEDEDGNKLELNDESDVTLLEALLGKNITMTGTYHSYHGGHGFHQITFSGFATDVTENVLSDVDALAADITFVKSSIPEATKFDITLPATGTNGTVFTNWTSSKTNVFSNTGAFVLSSASAQLTVTFTATATKGDETETITVDVIVPLTYSLDAAAELSEDSYVAISGVVYLESYYGFHIAQNGNYIFVADTTYLDDIEPGDRVTVVGQMKSLYHGAPQVASFGFKVTSSGNALPTAVVASLSEVINVEVPFGTLVTLTGKVMNVASGSYFDLFFDDATGNRIQIHYNSNDWAIDDFDGQIVTADFLIYASDYLWFYGATTDVTVETAFTDLQTAEAIALTVADGLGNVDGIVQNLTLPLTNTLPVATITWATSDATVITDAGVVTFVSGSQPTATLTMTVTVGTTDYTKDIDIKLLDADDLTPVDVATALLADDGNTVIVTGVVTGFAYTHGAFIQDADGTAIFLDESLEDDLAIGDLVVVVGTLETRVKYGNDQRKLTGVAVIEVTSQDNTVFVNTTVLPATLGVVATIGTYSSQTFTMTLTFADYQTEDGGTFDAGTLGYEDNYGYYFFVGDGTTYITMYGGNCTNCDLLYAVGDTITLTFSVYDINFDNVRIDNVTMPAFTPAQNLVLAENMLTLTTFTVEDLTLPTANAMYNATITWSSDTPANISNAGVVVRPAIGAADATVVLTATITVGTETPVTKDFTVTVPALPEDVAFAMAAADNAPIYIIGVVTSVLADGTFTIEDADGTAIYVDDYKSTITDFSDNVVVAVGDSVEVGGLKSVYNGFNLMDYVSTVTVISSGNAITAPIVVTDLATFRAAVDVTSFGKRYSFTDIWLDDQGFYLYFYTEASYQNRMGILGDFSSPIVATLGDDKVSFVATLYMSSGTFTDPSKILRFAVTVDSELTFTVLTDAEKLIKAKDALTLSSTAIENLTLPATDDTYDATITWSSATPATITNAGVIVRPAIGEADIDVVLTATITVGSETPVTKDFTVTVVAIPDPNGPVTENLTNFDGSTSTYTDSGTFDGVNGITWSYLEARRFTDDSTYTIGGSGTSIMFGSDQTRELSATITGGIASFSIDLKAGYTSGSGADRSVEIFVNDVSVGTYTLTAMGVVENFAISAINVEGSFTLKIVSTGTKQLVIDNITWAPYSAS